MRIDLFVEDVLKLLAKNKNVLLLGPPATGKSKIMSLVAERFSGTPSAGLLPDDPVPIPETTINIHDWMPSPSRINERKTFPITFHQGTKHRDFVSGIMPKLVQGETGFKAQTGILIDANQNAINNHGVSLIIIDEINRGPAVTIFGDTLSAIEIDKRLDENDAETFSSSPFYAIDSNTGDYVKRFLSPHVYILASMNEADTSVEPMDVAFLRRFMPYRVEPDITALWEFFDINDTTPIPEAATDPSHVLAALTKAWVNINDKIAIGRGDSFRIGHGIMMGNGTFDNLEEALDFASACWQKIQNHIQEVFFGNDISQSIIFNSVNSDFYKLEEVAFGEQPISKLRITQWNRDVIYKLLRQISSNGS